MSNETKTPFDKEPAEGSRDIVERELARQERRSNRRDPSPGGSARPRTEADDRSRGTKDASR